MPLSNHRPLLIAAILFVLAFDLAFAWQRLDGAAACEFGGHADEAAHYVTGLMVHDYFAAHCPGSPMKFGQAYYAHYPKIGLGVWPPVFYAVQAAWTLPFGISRQSLMLLMCVLAAIDALLVHVALRRDCGTLAAVLGGLLFICLPLVREYTGMVMAEMLSTAFMFGATLAFGNFLDEERPRDVLLFGLLAGLAILTKGTGLALGLMALFALTFTRRWRLLRHPALWAAAALTAILAGPWTWIYRDAGKGGWEQPHPSLAWTRQALLFFLGKFGASLGFVVFLLFCAGVLSWLRVGRKPVEAASSSADPGAEPLASRPSDRSRTNGRWAAFAALIAAVILFQSIFPAGKETRHLIAALPAAVAFAMLGFAACVQAVIARLRRAPLADWSPRLAFSYPALAAGLILMAATALPVLRRADFGFAKLAELALQQAQPNDVLLVSSDAVGEGMFIAEVARRDPHRPSYFVERASKELAASQWNGSGYRQKYEGADDLLAFLTSGKIRFLVVDESIPESKWEPHHSAVSSLVKAEPKFFWQIAFSDIWRNGEENLLAARLFRIEPLPLERRKLK